MEILEADGGNLAVAINAASLALADAGIAVAGLVGAVSLGSGGSSGPGKVIVDTSQAEEAGGQMPRLTLAALPRTNSILLLQLQQRLHFDLLGSIPSVPPSFSTAACVGSRRQ